MFIDRAIIEVRSGKGGDGALTFLREKNRPLGGPSGGNGGRGGSIYLRSSISTTTLVNFRHSRAFIAEDGENGANKLQYGKDAKDIYIDIPLGTVVYLEDSHTFIADFNEPNKVLLIAKGGRGGRGNACFKNARNKAPKIAENGLPGEKKRLILELKLLADVGIIGLPSVGKSTFISVVSNCKAEIADYPFTTIVPNLGVTYLDDGSSFVLADMPGLIEGAHLGKGLGLAFLRHIERTRVLIHLVDITHEDPYKDYLTIRHELEEYGMNLINKSEIVVASKIDEDENREKLKELEKKIGKKVYPLSSLTNEGVKEILYKAKDELEVAPIFPIFKEEEKEVVVNLNEEAPIFEIIKEKENLFVIKGEKVERTYDLINISTDEGMMRLITYLNKIGIDDALKEKGAKDGDIVKLKDFEFEYFE